MSELTPASEEVPLQKALSMQIPIEGVNTLSQTAFVDRVNDLMRLHINSSRNVRAKMSPKGLLSLELGKYEVGMGVLPPFGLFLHIRSVLQEALHPYSEGWQLPEYVPEDPASYPNLGEVESQIRQSFAGILGSFMASKRDRKIQEGRKAAEQKRDRMQFEHLKGQIKRIEQWFQLHADDLRAAIQATTPKTRDLLPRSASTVLVKLAESGASLSFNVKFGDVFATVNVDREQAKITIKLEGGPNNKAISTVRPADGMVTFPSVIPGFTYGYSTEGVAKGFLMRADQDKDLWLNPRDMESKARIKWKDSPKE